MIYVLMTLLIFAGDSFLKRYFEAKPDDFQKKTLGGHVLLRKSHNRGAMLNFMQDRQQMVAGFSMGITACLAGVYASLLKKKGRRLKKTGLAFLVGGACSNVVDRLRRGYVVDYFSFRQNARNFGKSCLISAIFLSFWERFCQFLEIVNVGVDRFCQKW